MVAFPFHSPIICFLFFVFLFGLLWKRDICAVCAYIVVVVIYGLFYICCDEGDAKRAKKTHTYTYIGFTATELSNIVIITITCIYMCMCPWRVTMCIVVHRHIGEFRFQWKWHTVHSTQCNVCILVYICYVHLYGAIEMRRRRC